MTSWLHRQRKQAILDLSREAGLKPDDDARKDDLIDLLDAHLQKNADRLSRIAAFDPYYSTRRTPAQPGASSSTAVASSDGPEVKSVVKARGRRVTQVKEELEDAVTSPLQAVAAALTERTPAPHRRRSELLPASPADVAEDMELAANRISTSIDNFYLRSGIPEAIASVRSSCSSVIAVQLVVILVEAWSLSRTLMPLKYAIALPSLRPFGAPFALKLPDLFVLLTGHFWSNTLLWANTNLILPLIAAYFFNLSTMEVKRHGSRVSVWRYTHDPLTFSIAKALLSYIIFVRKGLHSHLPLGFVDAETIASVDHAMLGGHNGVLVGCAVGALVSLYEAAQRK